MAEAYTTRGRAVLQEYGSNPEAWGGELNAGALAILDAMWGTTAPVTVNGNVTLTSLDKLPDQARGFVLPLVGTGGFTVTVPAQDKPYLIINNCAANVTIKPGSTGTTAVSRAGTACLFWIDSAKTTVYAVDPTLDKIKAPAAPVDMNSKRLTSLANPEADADGISRGYLNTRLPGTITISTSAPTGGSDGDIHFRVLP